ncbi:plant organelle RNA recognition domain-containing protein [Tanacetum coccineum]|uniref:Plant organelle RNA recognition domain-containing protein n=1 Tax=Tanacetum coccineum TaxID=301880 RepID=A0ABQ5CPF4_9ASTR
MEDIDHKAIKVNSLNMHIIQIGEDKVFVVGHDWGAIIVWQFCLFRPDKVKVEVNSKIASVQGDDSESWVLIPEMTFVGVESRVLIPEMTFVGVESRVLIPETTFVGVESRVLIPETTVWDILVYPSDTLVILRALAISLPGLRRSIPKGLTSGIRACEKL